MFVHQANAYSPPTAPRTVISPSASLNLHQAAAPSELTKQYLTATIDRFLYRSTKKHVLFWTAVVSFRPRWDNVNYVPFGTKGLPWDKIEGNCFRGRLSTLQVQGPE
uniref:Uncharacterized protein n=1 Tax=Rhodosorus marinus TaxID=101924 RepID=A0A7S3E5U6_9RHOD